MHGHAPADARDWAFADLQLLADAHELTISRMNPFATNE